jgi:hypothetical protein
LTQLEGSQELSSSDSRPQAGRETDMDSSFTIKPRPGVQKYAPRDPVPVRETTETDFDAVKSLAGSDDHGADQHERHQEHVPHDVVVDPESREVINRENDITAHTEPREHPDQALLRLRAYRPASSAADQPSPNEPHANIKA